jgi:hypothetical protein
VVVRASDLHASALRRRADGKEEGDSAKENGERETIRREDVGHTEICREAVDIQALGSEANRWPAFLCEKDVGEKVDRRQEVERP